MVKLVRRTSLGHHPVYDIGVQSDDHNFLLANGIVASNCFNKSHSCAYAYVTYQTAYLKANYGVEYMAALLTTNSSDQDKVQRYIASCVAMGLEIEPPDINRSEVDFTPVGRTILFGLSAVRNVGMGPIEAILTARAEGPFQSLADLCDRVDPRSLNRRALESLIYAGAFDQLEPNRQQSIKDLELVMDWAQSRARDRDSGQGNLFDLFGETTGKPLSGFDSAPKAPATPDFDPQERLRLEKEVVGFYISNHPLKELREAARILAPMSISHLNQVAENTTVSAIVMLSSVKPVITKKGDRMAILMLEDLTGQVDAVVFPKSYERIGGEMFKPDARLMVWGKVDRRDDQLQFIVDDAEPVERVRMVLVELSPQNASDIAERQRLKTLILEQQGEKDKAKISVLAVVQDQGRKHVVRFGPQFRVQDDRAVVAALKQAGFEVKPLSLAS
jgi:DNA polymerase III subunit alpha